MTKSIVNGAVTGKKVKDGSIGPRDLKAPPGIDPASNRGPPGAEDDPDAIPTLALHQQDEIRVDCEAGEVAISGGGAASDGAASVDQDLPFTTAGKATGWVVGYVNDSGSAITNLQLSSFALCVPVG